MTKNPGGHDGSRVPAYQRVKRALRETIANGEYTPNKPFITEREVRERFGVSATTAVRALNDLVAEGIVIRKQGKGTFVADRATALETPHSLIPSTGAGTIACILQNQGPHVGELLNGLERTFADYGYRLLLTHCQDDVVREEQALRAAIADHVSGIALYPADGHADVAAVEEVQRAGIPLVLVDRYRPEVATDAVLADNIAVGYDVTTALINLGHRRIATLWDETNCTSVRDRLTGHQQALREHKIAVRPELTVLRAYGRSKSLERLLNSTDPPTVLLCGNGYVLASVVNDLVELGVDVPGRVDLAGLDAAGPFDILPLTAVTAVLPSAKMGVAAAQLLHQRIDSETGHHHDVEHTVLPITIRRRDTAPGHLRMVLGSRPQ